MASNPTNTHSTEGASLKPSLSLGKIINLSMGFLGIQMGFALQNGNASRILQDFGADVHNLSHFWLVAPLTGLIVQPIIGHLGDSTWGRLGRRKPYFLIGAILAALGLIFLPNSNLVAGESMKATEFIGISAILWIGVLFLAMMDASFNVSMEPFRALVGDMLPKRQGALGFSVQTVLISIGAIVGSYLPSKLHSWFDISNEPVAGSIAPNVVWAFYIGAAVLMITILYTIITVKEYPPEEFARFQGDEVVEKRKANMFTAILKDTMAMPRRMKRLALVQFFSWFGLFTMWVYTTVSIAQNSYDVELDEVTKTELISELNSLNLNNYPSDKKENLQKIISALEYIEPSKEGLYFLNSSNASLLSQNTLIAETDLLNMVNTIDEENVNAFDRFQDEISRLKMEAGKGSIFVLSSALTKELSQQLPEDKGVKLVSKLKSVAKEHQIAGDKTSSLFGFYNFVALIFAFLLNYCAKRTSRKFVHFISLFLGGLGLVSMLFIKNPDYYLLSMFGVGMAWASILAMPYALLIDSLPVKKMGVYMGIFNFFIVLPQIINGLIAGPIIQNFFNNYASYYLMAGGLLMILAALLTLRVKEPLFRPKDFSKA